MDRQQGDIISLVKKITGGSYRDRQQGDLIRFVTKITRQEGDIISSVTKMTGGGGATETDSKEIS
jgi:hypothetical protein